MDKTNERYVVRRAAGFGPDGSDLFTVVDTRTDEPCDAYSDHPRTNGAEAEAMAKEAAAWMNEEAVTP